MFLIFKDKLVAGYDKYKLFYYIIEYLKNSEVKDYFFTYLELKRRIEIKNCQSLLEEITNDEKVARAINPYGMSVVYYRPIYNRINEPFLLESLFINYRGTDIYILYNGENRELNCFLDYFIIQDMNTYTEDLECIKKMGGKMVVHCEDFRLEVAKYIDELYMNSKTAYYNPNNWTQEFYKYLKSKKKYPFKIYYESIKDLNKLLYNCDINKKEGIMNYIIKNGIVKTCSK